MTNLQRHAALLGVVLLILGFATGALLASAMTGRVSADPHTISGAHLNALFGCLWLCALAFTLPLVRYGEVGARRLLYVTAVAAYANWLITIVKAFFHVAGVGLDGNGANDAVFAALGAFVVVPSFAASIAWAYGLARPKAFGLVLRSCSRRPRHAPANHRPRRPLPSIRS